MGLKAELRELLRQEAVLRGSFRLSGGATSDYYIDCRRVTLTPKGAHIIGRLFCELAESLNATAVAGLTLGADPLIIATGLASYAEDRPIKMAIVRKESKTHGLQRRIEGPPLKPSDRVLVLEDVTTTGGSVLTAVRAIREEYGCEVVGAASVVDRMEGAEKLLNENGIKFFSLFKKDELV